MTRLPQTSEAALVASICRESFYDFVQEFWSVVIQETPVWNWHIEYLCNEFQCLAERVMAGLPKEYDEIINISPGTTKSTIFSVLGPAWVWTRFPQGRIITGSYTDKLALDFSRKARDVIESDKYQTCFPHVKLRADQNTKSYYANTRGGDRYAVSTGGSVMGQHAHMIIIDDPIDPLGARSELELQTANNWISETLPSRKVNKEVTPTILIMQRLHQNDPSGYMLSKKKAAVRHICLPAMDGDNVQPAGLRRNYRPDPAHPDRGPVMDPVRLGWKVLEEARTDLGEYGFAGQYRQHPVPLGGGMFKVGKLVLEPGPPKRNLLRRVVRYWDKAGTALGGAYTVGLLMGLDTKGEYWILDVVRGQWSTNDREGRIAQTAKLDSKAVTIGIEQEGGSGGKESAEATVRRLAGYVVRVDSPKGDKALRADPFSVQVNMGNVHIVNAPWTKAYMDEMEYFPASTYKDQIDASSGAFAMLTKYRRAGVL